MPTLIGSAELSPRRRTALRLDLEDRQAELITELYGLSRNLVSPPRQHDSVPAEWRLALTRIGCPDAPPHGLCELKALDAGLARLQRINEALARLDGPAFGHCEHCGELIDFELLSADPVTRLCGQCRG